MATNAAAELQTKALAEAQAYATTLQSFIIRLEQYSGISNVFSAPPRTPMEVSSLENKLYDLMDRAVLDPDPTQPIPNAPSFEVNEIPGNAWTNSQSIPSLGPVQTPDFMYPTMTGYIPIPQNTGASRGLVRPDTAAADKGARPHAADVSHNTDSSPPQWDSSYALGNRIQTPRASAPTVTPATYSHTWEDTETPNNLTLGEVTPYVPPSAVTFSNHIAPDLGTYTPVDMNAGAPDISGLQLTGSEIPADYGHAVSLTGQNRSTISIPTQSVISLTALAPVAVGGITLSPVSIDPITRGDLNTVDRPTIADSTMRKADRPEIKMPDRIEMRGVSIPGLAEIETITFEGDPLTEFDATLPTTMFTYSEQEYESALGDAVRAELLNNILYGGYGINTSDELSLWARARDRELRGAAAATREMTRQMAARGFSLPPGALLAQIQSATQDGAEKISTVSREIALKRADMYVENRKFSFTMAKEMEQLAITLHMNIAERALNSAKFTADYGITLFNAEVARYNTVIAGFQARIAIFDARIRQAAFKLETQKLQLQAVGLELEAQKLEVQVYTAQIEAEKAAIEVYQIDVNAARSEVEAEISVSKNKVDVYTAELGANRLIADIYRTDVEAQKTLADVQLGEQRLKIEAYTAELGGDKVAIDNFQARLAEARTKAELGLSSGKLSIEQYNALNEAIRLEVEQYNAQEAHARNAADTALRREQAKVERFNAELAAKRAEIDLFQAKVAAERATGELEIAAAKNNIDSYSAQFTEDRLKLERYQAEATAKRVATDVSIERLKLDVAEHSTNLETAKTKIQQNQAKAEVEKVRVEATNSNNKFLLEKYASDIAARKAELDELMTSVEAEKARIGAQIQIKEVALRRWIADFEGVKIESDLYKTDLAYSAHELDVVRAHLELYKADIAEFEAGLKQNTLQLQYYDAQLKGDDKNASMYLAAIEAQKNLIEAAKAQASINQSNNQTTIERAKLEIATAEGKTKSFQALAQGVASNNDATARSFASRTESMRSMTNVYDNMAKIDLTKFDLESREAIARSQQILEADKVVWDTRIRSLVAGANTLAEAMKASLGQVIGLATVTSEAI